RVAPARDAGHVPELDPPPSTDDGLFRFARQGLLSNALNPKVALFFLTFLPQFLPEHPGPGAALGFAAVFAASYIGWFAIYVTLVDRIAALLRPGRVRRAGERPTAGFLAAFAVRLALQR